MSTITKATRFQIIKPLNTEWNEFGQVLRDLSYHTTKMCNAAVQLYWEHHNFRLAHKTETGKYPDAAMDKEKYGCSFQNHVYRKLRELYPDMASNNTSQTNQFAMKRWKNDTKDIMRLQKSIPSFRLGAPIQIANANYALSVEEQKGGGANYTANITLLSRDADKQTRYRVLLDGGDNSKKAIFRHIMDGEYKQGTMQIIYNKRKKKWFCVVAFTFTPERKDKELDVNRIMGIVFGAGEYSIYAAYNFGRKRYVIPAGELIAASGKVHAITERRKEIQRHAGYRGRGRDRKLKGIEGLAGRPTSIRDTLNHKYSRQIVDIAAANRCGVIRMVDVSAANFEGAFASWPWADLVEKIKYKAGEKGVEIEIVKPKGDKCYKCDTETQIGDDNILTCPKCDSKIEVVYNTAKRIANGS